MTRIIERSVDVAVPVRTAYNQWTQFEDFPRFMDGVVSVQQVDDTRLSWRVRIAGVEKEWTAEIREQVPDTRIAWHSLAGTANRGVVSFARVADEQARVTLRLEYEPDGWIENLGDALGILSGRVDRALEGFKEFLEDRGLETGAWRDRVAQQDAPLPRPTVPAPNAPAKGSETTVTRCPIHGTAYDAEREVCPECAKPGATSAPISALVVSLGLVAALHMESSAQTSIETQRGLPPAAEAPRSPEYAPTPVAPAPPLAPVRPEPGRPALAPAPGQVGTPGDDPGATRERTIFGVSRVTAVVVGVGLVSVVVLVVGAAERRWRGVRHDSGVARDGRLV